MRFLPHLWQVPAALLMALCFGGAWYAVLTWGAPVDMSCRRDGGGVSCDVTTQLWPAPSVVHLSDRDLAGASLVLNPQQYDHSFHQVALTRNTQGHDSATLLVEFSQDIREPGVSAINDFLSTPSAGPVSERIDAPTFSRMGLLTVQVMPFFCLALMLVAIVRRTTITIGNERLTVHRSRWPLARVSQQLDLRQIADVTAVSRIPEGLAQTVAALPWRNIYRANALAARLQSGDEVLLTEWCKRSAAFHQRLAEKLRTWLSAARSSSPT